MKRLFECKLSIHSRSPLGTISSPYSQGLISPFESYRRAAEQIATKIGSVGPLNIQGRVKDGVLMPFEINPRFSGSTYLRALAGFNEIDLFLRYMIDGTVEVPFRYRYGYYFRSLSEVFVKEEDLKR
jgi:carbamoyl-phosphate synthase large subunit